MPLDGGQADFKAIAGNAKKSDAYRKMTGKSGPAEPDADDAGGSDETLSLGDAFDAAQDGNRDAFQASMLAAIKSCIANYGTVTK